jgi:hypothetical protein
MNTHDEPETHHRPGPAADRCLAAVVVAATALVAGCASAPPGATADRPAPGFTRIEPYGPLSTVTVDVAGAPRRFLLDTGGGMTVFAPALAARSGCALGGPITGFRMSGERLDAPRCEGATVGLSGWSSRPHTVMVLDVNQLLPADWPRLDGLLSLSSFRGHVVTLDLPGGRLVVDDQVPARARSVRARFEHAMAGLSLVAFMASRHGQTDLWLEMDTGSTSALIVNEDLAPALGLKPPVAAGAAEVDLRIDGGAPVRTPVETRPMIFDGNIGQGTMRRWVLTFDLQNERVWVRTP